MNNINKIYNNKLPKQLTKNQLEVLKMQLIKLNLHNKLLLTINKRIQNYPHIKINDKMSSSLNQNITYNFSQNKGTNSNINLNKENENIFKYTNSSARVGVINFIIKIITSIFNSLYCVIAKPQFINKHDKLIIRIPYYQNNVKKDSLFTNTDSNRVFNILTNNLSDNNILNYNNNNSTNITKNSIIK
jgi:predicted PurR-regulated permease PerM